MQNSLHKAMFTVIIFLLPDAFTRASEGTRGKDLEQIGSVIHLTGDRDARGVPDPATTPEGESQRRSCRMPDMITLSDTEWLVVYNEYPTPFSTGDWSRIVVQATRDGGKTLETQVVNEQKKSNPDFLGNWNMSRFGKLPDGTLMITSCVRFQGNRCYLFFSSDGGRSWAGPMDSRINEVAKEKLGRDISYVESSRIAALADGTLVMTACRGEPLKHPPSEFGGKKESVEVIDIFHSKDKGHSWDYVSAVMDMNHDLSEAALLADGQTLQMYCRDDRKEPLDSKNVTPRGLVIFRSSDGGRTWTKVKFAREAPGHQPGITLLKNGRALAIYRRSDPQNVSCEVWLHDPKTFEGKTYTLHAIPQSKSVFKIDAGAANEVSDGTVLLCYSSYRTDGGSGWHYAEKRVRIAVLPSVDRWEGAQK